ncbi:uncharacterized protein VP01_1020g6 [Puccinia sorghi]|uniref:Uncharacterized protein n=1 Tax=Puccinia sorghi TaxID=27349 RepID=A0A0L6VV62_9BASI|nr:uncharacterized protein VP01_1020g6 [Puccinia sorghi]
MQSQDEVVAVVGVAVRPAAQPPKASRLGWKAGLVAKPLQPSVVQTMMTKATMRWNHYRSAKAELGLYLLMDSEPMFQGMHASECEASEHYLASNQESETSMSSGDDIPPWLYTPRRLPLVQQLKNWWRYS